MEPAEHEVAASREPTYSLELGEEQLKFAIILPDAGEMADNKMFLEQSKQIVENLTAGQELECARAVQSSDGNLVDRFKITGDRSNLRSLWALLASLIAKKEEMGSGSATLPL